MNPEEEIEKGIKLLDPTLNEFGFRFKLDAPGASSGGRFCAGFYEKENRRLFISVRYSLGCVEYELGSDRIGHADYMRAIGVKGAYPGFSENTFGAFEHLLQDLQLHADVFLKGSNDEIKKIFTLAKNTPKKKGFSGLS